MPEFSGRDHEDPNLFIQECEDIFYIHRIELHMRTRFASRALKDDAARWWAVYRNLALSSEKLSELLRGRYASQSVLMRLCAKLYGQQQTGKESAALFLE